ncbi:hypothetical protein TRIATDRAFT_294460 [Trichoderma atroviride IMI 206040]|uniref:SH3 domain-containing protein n=2 Tax=Hypocrea atroviridis TaxID=63577 RepID=G9P1Z8_HYPAI|nr:uncharacterized protein TRIATDRAFT_294460 [Trichoderma atroviride IMI 206040]EHK43424.1 hypothetical protein TRIATDRAFT_294460 [Trichoderma atroviride IMI 206040]
MPISHRHLHQHRRRDILDDIDDIVHGKNPFDDGDNDDDNGDGKKEHENGDKNSDSKGQSLPTEASKPSPKPDAQSKETPKDTPTPAKETPKETPKNTPSQQQKTPPAQKTSSAEPTAIHSPQQTQSESQTVLAKATGSPTQAVDGNRAHSGAASPTIDAASASSTPSSVSAASSGTSAGAKAGIAIGVLGGVFVIGLLVFFLVSRRRKQAQAEQLMDDNEKVQPAPPPPVQPRAITPVIAISPPVSPPLSPAMSPEPIDDMPVRSNPNAPRISLRPVTQFLPNWSLEKQAAAAAAGGAVGVAVTGDAADRPNTSQSDHPANPFGQQAERVPSPIHEDASAHASYTPSEMSVSDSASIPEIPHAGEAVAATAVAASAIAAGAAGAVAGASTLARKQSMRNRNPNNVDLTVNTLDTVPPSPAGTEFSVSTPATGPAPVPQASQSAAAIAAAGGPANSTVHRVQLDFKPTLDDEVELKAGDLIRLLHEYDDGWALVIRMDRSQQGVAPRTCLSTRPVKPRPPQGPPPGHPAGPPRGANSPTGQRPMTPQSQRPMTPQGKFPPNGAPRMVAGPGSRPASPAGPMMNRNGAGRPQSPMGRPMSPGPKHQGPPTSRPQSPSVMNQQQQSSPTGSSPLNPNSNPTSPTGPPAGPAASPIERKPVPGQAY